MSCEIGGTFGVSLVWGEMGEQYHEDCIGATKKRDGSVMCWGMIGWGWKRIYFRLLLLLVKKLKLIN
jgi:hypothetical protein